MGLAQRVADAVVEVTKLFELVYTAPARLGPPIPTSMRPGVGADPIILVSGFANTAEGWDPWVRSLRADGFRVYVYDSPSGGLGDMHESARLLRDFIEEVKRRTGRRRIDLVGFSEGGLLARMYVAQLGGAGSVDRLISVSTPHHGIPLSWLVDPVRAIPLLGTLVPPALYQLMDSHTIHDAINAADAVLRLQGGPGAPRYASIYARVPDPIVTPHSAWLPGAYNIPVRHDGRDRLGAPSHATMFRHSDRAYMAARLLLADQPNQAALDAGIGAYISE
ncbi:MAG: lipase [Thermoleophilia bacterium]|nr:lipase [Thermoleophilia bacterium]